MPLFKDCRAAIDRGGWPQDFDAASDLHGRANEVDATLQEAFYPELAARLSKLLEGERTAEALLAGVR